MTTYPIMRPSDLKLAKSTYKSPYDISLNKKVLENFFDVKLVNVEEQNSITGALMISQTLNTSSKKIVYKLQRKSTLKHHSGK
jgi:hypothetical protein